MLSTNNGSQVASSSIRTKRPSTMKGDPYVVKVTVLGMAGLTVDTRQCRTDSKSMSKHTPAPPNDMRAIVSFACHSNVQATTALSQPLQAAPGEGVSQRHVAVWTQSSEQPLGSTVLLKTNLARSIKKGGKNNSTLSIASSVLARKNFDMTVGLTDSSGRRKVALPIAAANLAVSADQATGQPFTMDLPLYPMKDGNSVMSLTNKPQKKRGLGKIFSKSGEKAVSPDEKKAFYSAYSIDHSGDAVIRIEVEIKENKASSKASLSSLQYSQKGVPKKSSRRSKSQPPVAALTSKDSLRSIDEELPFDEHPLSPPRVAIKVPVFAMEESIERVLVERKPKPAEAKKKAPVTLAARMRSPRRRSMSTLVRRSEAARKAARNLAVKAKRDSPSSTKAMLVDTSKTQSIEESPEKKMASKAEKLGARHKEKKSLEKKPELLRAVGSYPNLAAKSSPERVSLCKAVMLGARHTGVQRKLSFNSPESSVMSEPEQKPEPECIIRITSNTNTSQCADSEISLEVVAPPVAAKKLSEYQAPEADAFVKPGDDDTTLDGESLTCFDAQKSVGQASGANGRPKKVNLLQPCGVGDAAGDALHDDDGTYVSLNVMGKQFKVPGCGMIHKDGDEEQTKFDDETWFSMGKIRHEGVEIAQGLCRHPESNAETASPGKRKSKWASKVRAMMKNEENSLLYDEATLGSYDESLRTYDDPSLGTMDESSVDNTTLDGYTLDGTTLDGTTLDGTAETSLGDGTVSRSFSAKAPKSNDKQERPRKTEAVPKKAPKKCAAPVDEDTTVLKDSSSDKAGSEKSPQGVAEFFRAHTRSGSSNNSSIGQTIVSILTCSNHAVDVVHHESGVEASNRVPSTLIQEHDDGSIGDLTATTLEMQVEIERLRQKIKNEKNTPKTPTELVEDLFLCGIDVDEVEAVNKYHSSRPSSKPKSKKGSDKKEVNEESSLDANDSMMAAVQAAWVKKQAEAWAANKTSSRTAAV